MDVLLERLSSGQIVAVISIVTSGIVAVSMIIAISKYQFQALADETALKQQKQQADLALRERFIERREASGEKASIGELLTLGVTPSETDLGQRELARRFGMLDADAGEIERSLALALATDPGPRKMIVAVMDELLECGAASESILAAIRPLCATVASKKGPLKAEAVA